MDTHGNYWPQTPYSTSEVLSLLGDSGEGFFVDVIKVFMEHDAWMSVCTMTNRYVFSEVEGFVFACQTKSQHFLCWPQIGTNRSVKGPRTCQQATRAPEVIVFLTGKLLVSHRSASEASLGHLPCWLIE